MSRELPNDYAINAMTAEVERRRKLTGRRYDYGKLIADTTPAERETIAENYRRRVLRLPPSEGRYREPDDLRDMEKAAKRGTVAKE